MIFKKKNFWVWGAWLLGILGYFFARMMSKGISNSGGVIETIFLENAPIQPTNEALYIMSITQCLQNPQEVFKIVWMTIVEKADKWIFSLAGTEMFWYDNGIPSLFSLILVVLLVLSFVYDSSSKGFIVRKWHKWWTALIIVGIIIAAIFVMIIADGIYEGITPGVQGRYFLPILPLFVLLNRNKLENNEGDERRIKGNIVNVYIVYGLCILYTLLTVLIR